MCGIFGAARLNGRFGEPDFQCFVRQTDLVSYRGPDDSDYRGYDVRGSGREDRTGFDVFLGHRRLSIIDLSPQGRQPLTDGQGRWIIFVGEIFNYVELREELRGLGHSFRTATDTEVILKIYQQYGDAGFARMNGMWAFAILDIPAKRLVLSRDRFSIKGLYYLLDGDQLVFGSEIKQLLPFLRRRSVDRDVMHKYLTQAVADYSDRTFFEGVRHVRPKHSLILDLAVGHVEQRQYWDYAIEPVDAGRGIEAFRDLFVDSVRLRLRSDVPVGGLLSGGLDSSAVMMVTNHVLGAGLQTYSVIGTEPRYSEERFVDVIARTGIPNRRIRYDSASALGALEQAVYHNDEPCFGFSPVAEYRMLERIKAETGIKVVLSGQGGDECLLGYKKYFFFYLRELLRRGRVVRVAQEAISSLLRGTVLRQFRFGEARRYFPGPPRPAYVRLRGDPEPVGLGAGVRERQIRDIDQYSIPVLAHWEDRFAMAHSIELRTPFLDHRLVNLALSLPTELKIRGGWTKYVLRRAVPELPREVRWRRDKEGFLTPEERWLRNELRPVMEDRFGGGRSVLAGLDIIDPQAFLSAYRAFLAGRSRVWYADFTRVLTAEVWAWTFLS